MTPRTVYFYYKRDTYHHWLILWPEYEAGRLLRGYDVVEIGQFEPPRWQ